MPRFGPDEDMVRLSRRSLYAIAEIITGGSNSISVQPIGQYRSASKLHEFFVDLNLEFFVGRSSRVDAVRSFLLELNGSENGFQNLARIVEAVMHPSEFIGIEARLDEAAKYLNDRLKFDRFELRRMGKCYKLVSISTDAPAVVELLEKARGLNMESAQANFQKALEEADVNPEGAITLACSTVESVCKFLLDEMSLAYPPKQDIGGLAKEVSKHLNLSAGRKDLPLDHEHDIRQILSGLISVVAGIGALRTHAGDAHGRGKIRPNVDARIARLAIHSASTISIFYIETWTKRKMSAGGKP